MLIVIICCLLLIAGILLYQLYKCIRWLLRNPIYGKITLIIVIILSVSFVIQRIFFIKMEVIPSKIYPTLYLIKNLDKDSIKVNALIQKTIKKHYLNSNTKTFKSEIKFYEYSNFWNSDGNAGTVHFIENLEDPGGFSSEELMNYDDQLIAISIITTCKNKVRQKCAVVNYYKNRRITNSEILELTEIAINKN